MKKSILFLAFSFLISTLSAQVAISRILTVKEGQQEKFMKLAAEKTQKFNSKSGQPAYYTFSIETGPDAGKLWRVQVEDEMSDFDTIDKVGNDYWQSTVGKMHATANTQHWWRNKGTSYEAESAEYAPLKRAIFYTIKANGGDDFWRFRTRVAAAMKASELPFTMDVWNCGSGCNGNVVMVVFSHKNYGDQYTTNSEQFPKLVEKYDEMYGKDAYDQDNTRLESSLEMLWGRRIVHMNFLPELSSPADMN